MREGVQGFDPALVASYPVPPRGDHGPTELFKKQEGARTFLDYGGGIDFFTSRRLEVTWPASFSESEASVVHEPQFLK